MVQKGIDESMIRLHKLGNGSGKIMCQLYVLAFPSSGANKYGWVSFQIDIYNLICKPQD